MDFGKRKNTYNVYSTEYQNSEFDGKINNVYCYGNNLFFSFIRSMNNTINTYNVYINFDDPMPIVYKINIKYSSSIPVQPIPEILGLSQGKIIYQILPYYEVIFKKLQSVFEDLTIESNPILVFYNLNNLDSIDK